jgi:hypothetical protein
LKEQNALCSKLKECNGYEECAPTIYSPSFSQFSVLTATPPSTLIPNVIPTFIPILIPTSTPTLIPTVKPSASITASPTFYPTVVLTSLTTLSPSSISPSSNPTFISILNFKNVTTYAGNGNQGYTGDNNLATSAEINTVGAMSLDVDGNICFADDGAHVIRKVTKTTKIISTIAGNGIYGYSGDGGSPKNAQLYLPYDVVFDSTGSYFHFFVYSYIYIFLYFKCIYFFNIYFFYYYYFFFLNSENKK